MEARPTSAEDSKRHTAPIFSVKLALLSSPASCGLQHLQFNPPLDDPTNAPQLRDVGHKVIFTAIAGHPTRVSGHNASVPLQKPGPGIKTIFRFFGTTVQHLDQSPHEVAAHQPRWIPITPRIVSIIMNERLKRSEKPPSEP